MQIRVLPESLINQIAAGEVVERPASVVKELVENALDAGADNIVIDCVDGGRTLISVIDNGAGMSRDDLARAITRHATSKLPDDDLLNIHFMGFRGEALPSIASVSDMTIDTHNGMDENGWTIDCATGNVRPSAWDSGTRVRVANLFAKTPARLKFLRGDRAEMMAIVDTVKKLAMARPDVGFTLNNKWFFPRNMDIMDRIIAVMGDDVSGRMLDIDAASTSSSDLKIHGFISEPTLHRASSSEQYLFVNSRPVKDSVLVGALRAAYMDVMHAREFPLCALWLELSPQNVDVNVSPAKTEVHFLEPTHVRSFIIKTLRSRLADTMQYMMTAQNNRSVTPAYVPSQTNIFSSLSNNMSARDNMGGPRTDVLNNKFHVRDDMYGASSHVARPDIPDVINNIPGVNLDVAKNFEQNDGLDFPLGRAIGQIGNKYILAVRGETLVIIDQHAAHERITYEKMRRRQIHTQPLLAPIVIHLRPEDVMSVLTIRDDLRDCGLVIDEFGDDSIAIFEKPSDWDLDWTDLFKSISDEVRSNGHSSKLGERLHLKLANYACHRSVRAGQRLDMAQMTALMRDIEQTEHGGECNHGRPVYKFIPFSEIDKWFERS